MKDQTWIDAINQNIQERLKQSGMVYEVVELRSRPDLDMEIIVDDKVYKNLDEVDDQAVRYLIQSAIDGWQDEVDSKSPLSSSDQSGIGVSPVSTVKLWTPTTIGFITFFLGFPGGIVLSSINWMRMGLEKKALAHLIGGVLGALIFILLIIFLPSSIGRFVGFGANLAMLAYLNRQMRKDIGNVTPSYRVQNAHWFGGCLIGLVCLGFFMAASFGLGIFFLVLGVPIPE